MKLMNKRIVITGGTSGIGLQLVQQLQTNNQVIVIGRDNNKLAELAKQYQIKTYQADLSDLQRVNNIGREIVHDYEQIDVLINNAAVQNTASFIDSSFNIDDMEKEVTTNFTATCSLIYWLLPRLQSAPEAIILNINSGLGLAPKTSSAIYCATKAALNSLSQSLNYQLENTQVSVLQAFLPLVDSQMTQGRGDNKMSIADASNKIIKGLERGIINHDIGKVKLLRWLLRLSPVIASNVMKRA